MDHLPLHGKEPPITVPYLLGDGFQYDGGDFDTYPERCGWDFSEWIIHDRLERPLNIDAWLKQSTISKAELPRFLQAWLFFGQTFLLFGNKAPTADFIRILEDETKIISTANLEEHFVEYAARFPKISKGESKPSKEVRERAKKEVSRVWKSIASVVIMLLTLEGILSLPHEREDEDLYRKLEEVQFITTLLSSLISPFFEDFVKSIDPDLRPDSGYSSELQYGRSRLVERHMRASNWCPNTLNRLSFICTFTMQAYLYILGTERTSQKHDTCTIDCCAANQAGSDFDAKHLACSGVDCEFVEAPIDEIVRVLREGYIPILQIRFNESEYDKPCLEVKRVDGKTAYAAISHVWADGLGNSKGNSIPMCQIRQLLRPLQRVQYLKNEINRVEAKENGLMMPFWLDTLCIPVKSEHKALRDFSIQKMHEIYSQAHCALVLDKDFMQLTSKNSTLYEVLSRVCLSAWISRLWTFQEGSFPELLYIRVKDGIIDLTKSCSLYLDESDNHSLMPSPVKPILINSCIVAFRITMPRFSRTELGKDRSRHTVATLIEESLDSMCWRSTSRPGDETVCFATSMGLNPSTILNIQAPESTDEGSEIEYHQKRMIEFLKLLPSIPMCILFSAGPRLAAKGYSWAPSTLLRPATMLASEYEKRANFGDENLIHAYIHPKETGLIAFLPSILLSVSDRPTTPWHIICKDGTHFRVSSISVESSLKPEQQPSRKMAIVLPNMPNRNKKEALGIICRRDLSRATRDPRASRLSMKFIPAAHIFARAFVTWIDPEDAHTIPKTDYVVKGASNKLKWWFLGDHPAYLSAHL